MAFQLQMREYQSRLVESTVRYFTEPDPYTKKPSNSVMLLSPCGSGKTVTAMRIIDEMVPMGYSNVAFIAHRTRLLHQASDYLETMGLRQKHPNLKFNPLSIYETDISHALNADLVIFDEAHHSACDSGVRLLGRLNSRKVLGLTATNWRSDRIKLVFDRLVEDYGIKSLIELGYLSQFDHYSVEKWNSNYVTDLYLSDVPRYGKSIMYFHGEHESENAVNLLNRAGIRAESVYSYTKESEREAIYSRFELGETKVLCNLMLLTEGVDFPDLQSVFVKPSIKGLTIQMAGRALRTCAGKTHANVIQMAGAGYSFTRNADSRNSYVYKDGRWVQTKYSKEFISQLTAKTMSYRLKLATDKLAMTSMEFKHNTDVQKGIEYISGYRNNLRNVQSLDDLEHLTEGD